MEIDTRFPTRLNTISDAPEPFRSALAETLSSNESTPLIVHAPAFASETEKVPATVFLVTSGGWVVASEAEGGSATVERSGFSGTLYLELKAVLLSGQLRISYAGEGKPTFTTIKFETVEDEYYREGVDLILAGIDPALRETAQNDRNESSMLEGWPMKIRNEAHRFWPGGRRFLAAKQWPAVPGEEGQELVSAGALLMTERELVVITEEKEFAAESAEEAPPADESKEIFGGIITFVPRVRLKDFHMSHQEKIGILTLQVRTEQCGDTLEVRFPPGDERDVSEAMELFSRSPQAGAQAKGDQAQRGSQNV
jgi:hypothetical protein